MASLVLIMSAYQAGLGYVVVRWLAPRTPLGALLLGARGLGVRRMVARLVSFGIPVAVAGLLADRHLACGTCAAGWRAPAEPRAADGRWRAQSAVARTRGDARAGAGGAGAAVDHGTRAARQAPGPRPSGAPLSVAIVQGAIPQDMKWLVTQPAEHPRRIRAAAPRRRWARSSSSGPNPRCRISPTCIRNYIGAVWSAARRSGSAVLMGVMRAEQQDDDTEDALLQFAAGDGHG